MGRIGCNIGEDSNPLVEDNGIGPPGGMAYVAVDAKPNPAAARKELARVKALRAEQWSAERLALDSIRRPVRYDPDGVWVIDREGEPVVEIRGAGRLGIEGQDAVGEFIARLINEAK